MYLNLTVCTFSTWFIIGIVLSVICNLTKALTVSGGNRDEILDTSYPILIEETTSSNSYFGYTVSLAKGHDRPNHPEGWIFIGAPKANTSRSNKYSQSGKDIEPGVIWRCSLGRSRSSDDSCEMMNIDPPFGSRPGNPRSQSHDGAWIGVSSEIHHDRFVTCGMRWNRGDKQYYNGICYWFADSNNSQITTYRTNDLKSLVDTSMYDQRLFPFFTKFIKDDPINDESLFRFVNRSNMHEKGHEWQLSQAGLSIHLFKDEKLGTSPNLLIGAPGVRQWAGAVVLYTNPERPFDSLMERPNRNPNDPTFSEFVVLNRGVIPEKGKNGPFYWEEYFGYSVSSGKYLERGEVLYAAGAPRADHSGAVIIFTYPPAQPSTKSYKRQIKPVVNITAPKNSFGSYFGSVIHSVDLDGNGLDELIIGAPLYTFNTILPDSKTMNEDMERFDGEFKGKGEKAGNSQEMGDHGGVFVYKFKNNESDPNVNTNPIQTMVGSMSSKARFGSAITTFTLILKTNMREVYLVIGAPFEPSDNGGDSSGAIYVYTYNKKLGKFDAYSQRITASRISSSLSGFGSSLSIPEDVDMNDTPDLAVGAFKSGHAVVLRTRPRILLNSSIFFQTPEQAVVKEVRRGSKQFYLRSCYNVEETFGLAANKLRIWTKLRFSDRTIRFHERHVNERPGNTKNEIIYFRDVNAHNETCTLFTIQAVHKDGFGMDDSDAIYEIVNPFRFVQEVWYNETLQHGDPKVLKIYTQKLAVQPAIQNFDFSSFNKLLPSSQISTTTSAIAVSISDCRDRVCRPKLEMTWAFFNPNSRNQSMTSYMLGLSQEIIMQVVILNTGETAEKSTITFDWNVTEITESTSGDRWLNKSCTEVPDSTLRIYEKCHLRPYIKTGRNVTILIHFNVDHILAKDPKNFDFVVNAKVKFEDRHIQQFKSSGVLQMQVPTTMVTITGSADNEILRGPVSYYVTKRSNVNESQPTMVNEIRKSYVLYAPFRQRFTIVIKGASVEELNASFRIPVSYNGMEDTSKQMFLIKQPQISSMNIKCESPSSKYSFHMIDVINPGVSPNPESLGRVASREHNYNIIDQPNVVRRRRDATSQSTESPEPANGTTTPQQPTISQDNFLPMRPEKPKRKPPPSDETSLKFMCTSEEAYCLDVKCTIRNVKANIPMRIPFEIFPIKESIDNLLKSNGKPILFIKASGSVRIFPSVPDRSHYMDNDVAETTLTKISGRVDTWVYFAAAGGGIFLLACIIVGLYMCGFFKREKRQELNNLKAEHNRKSMMMAAARASMMIQSTSAAADGFESRENLTEAEHQNEDTEIEHVKSAENVPPQSTQEKMTESKDNQ